MQVIKDIAGVSLNDSVVTTGNFDGVHLGHRFLLDELLGIASLKQLQTVVVMFYPHPREVLGFGNLSYLNSIDDKIELLEQIGIDVLVLLPFNKEMAQWGTEKFVRTILIDHLGMQHFHVGYDHRLGNPHQPANLTVLSQKYNFALSRSTPYLHEGIKVSSSEIRKCLSLGDVQTATVLLGREYVLPCTVVSGMKVGRTINFPTANLELHNPKMLIPKEGVYAGRLKTAGGMFNGMLQVGRRPTLNDERGLTIEIHLFNFSEEIYGQDVKLYFVSYVRDNIKFDSVELLVEQLVVDGMHVRQILMM